MADTSFLVPAPDNSPAPFLFSDEAMQKLDGLERAAVHRGEWTGERLRAEAPRLVEAVLRLSSLDVTQEEIAYALQVSPNSVRKIQQECAAAVDGYKERLGGKLRKLTMLTIGAMAEKLEDPLEVDKMKIGELAIVAGITIEKEQLVSGGATQRIEHTSSTPPIEAFNDYIASLPSANATAIPVTMDCEAREMVQKAAAVDAGSSPLADLVIAAIKADRLSPDRAPITPSADGESAALPVGSTRDPACDPVPPPQEPPSPPSGEPQQEDQP